MAAYGYAVVAFLYDNMTSVLVAGRRCYAAAMDTGARPHWPVVINGPFAHRLCSVERTSEWQRKCTDRKTGGGSTRGITKVVLMPS